MRNPDSKHDIKNILIFSRYDDTQASTRIRFLQYMPYFLEKGLHVELFPILNIYGIVGRSNKLQFLKSRLISYYKVLVRLLLEKSKRSILLIHFELFPFIPFWIEYGFLLLTGKRNYIIELDDAWFHRYDAHHSFFIRFFFRNKIYQLMRHSILVISGNQYIADHAIKARAKHVEIIPSVVDVKKYRDYIEIFKNNKQGFVDLDTFNIKGSFVDKNIPLVGWIGSPATTKCLLSITKVIKSLHSKGIANFAAIGADIDQLSGLPIKVIPWQENIELDVLYQFDIGIMPLTDSIFERGKCGYKLIQYMACGLPVVASPVGVNCTIVLHNETGFLASSEDEWIHYLSTLCNDKTLRNCLGKRGLSRAEENYNLKVTSLKYVSLVRDASKNLS